MEGSRWDVSSLALVGANLIPLAGVLFLGWDMTEILVLYWAENVVAGFFYILKMLLRPADFPVFHLFRLFDAAFFVLHYGGFCAAHGVFVLALVSLHRIDLDAFLADPQAGYLLAFENRGRILGEILLPLARDLAWPLAMLVFSHGISFVRHHFLAGERDRLTTRALTAAPYSRMAVLHVALCLCGIPVVLLRSPLPLLVLLIVAKTVVDLVLHRRAHARASSPADDGVRSPGSGSA
ncbi:MAG: hypothetical protein HY608_12045 [Planctomycetes bacterium]|nr:hypothetical protein [Planctomycetota bacterium]